MSTNAIPAAGPATIVDCPLCDAPVPFVATHDELDCSACGASLPLAADPLQGASLTRAA
jgi:hypothetical protein